MPRRATVQYVDPQALKRGSYRVEIQLGQNAAHLGVKMVRTIKIA